jgi:DNA-binding transcriptional MocR family regulator
MIDLVWNFPLLKEQQALWSRYLAEATEEWSREPVESQRPSFRTVEPKLRERAAKWMGFPVERTWMTCGNHHGTLNSLMASGLTGGRVAMEGVSYPGFLDQCRMTKTEMLACEVDDDGVVPESLREVCARAKAEGGPVGGFFTMATVQNPLGFVTPLRRREEVVEIAREFDLTIIQDDAYGYMEEDAPPNYAELAPERTFYVRGLAKSLAPGARTGFLVAPSSAVAGLVMSLKCTATGTDVPANMAALKICEDGTLDALMEKKRVEGAVRNRAARDLLAGADVAAGARCAWHLWVRLPKGVSVDRVEEEISARGVIVTNGKWCAVTPEFGRGLRVALGGEVERERMLEGVGIVAGVLRGL